jgi:hypothetical protein
MRRLKNKIKIEPLQDDLFRDLLRRISAEKGILCSPEMEELIVEECRRRSPDGLRGCFPVDLMGIVEGMAKFDQRDAVLSKAEVERALRLYFVH